MSEGIATGFRGLAPQGRDGRHDVHSLDGAHTEFGQELICLLQPVHTQVTGFFLGRPYQVERTSRRIMEPVRLFPDVVDIHGEFGEEVEDTRGGSHVLPLAHGFGVLRLTGDRGALGADEGGKAALVGLAVRVVTLRSLQRPRIASQGAGSVPVALGDVLHELACFGEPRHVVLALFAVPVGPLPRALGRCVDLDQHVVEALELVGVPLDEGGVAAFEELDVLAVAQAGHFASGVTYWPSLRTLSRKRRVLASSTATKSVPVVLRRVASAARSATASRN